MTVARFRKFVAAWSEGWRPEANSGRHEHVDGGMGLIDSDTASEHEQGWDPAWVSDVSLGNADLACGSPWQNWTDQIGPNENRPINCVDWYEAYAFCIWDNAFLPSEAESNYAASGGSEQRVYPWSSPAGSTAIDCSFANYGGIGFPATACIFPGTGGTNDVAGESPKGDGRFGQADLAGNVWEWNLDQFARYGGPCFDCASMTVASSNRAARGGSFNYPASALLAANRYSASPSSRDPNLGVRCARAP